MRDTARPTLVLLGFTVLAGLAGCDERRPPLAQDVTAQALVARADPGRGGRLIVERGCLACHVVPQINGPVVHVGPLLDQIGRQAYVSGVLPNTSNNLVRWLRDPPAIHPSTAMPNMGLHQDEAEDIAAFLITLP